jgi:hypothetical protein
MKCFVVKYGTACFSNVYAKDKWYAIDQCRELLKQQGWSNLCEADFEVDEQ